MPDAASGGGVQVRRPAPDDGRFAVAVRIASEMRDGSFAEQLAERGACLVEPR